MNTPTHAVLNLALLGRRSHPEWNPSIIWGGLIPDLAMFVFFGWARLATDMTAAEIWGEAYYEPGWQALFDIWNSIPLALVGVGLGLGLARRWGRAGTGLTLCCTSVILHCLADLPVHREDAHRHFWPLSNFRFASPVSYWDPNYFGGVFAVFELALVLGLSVYVWKLVRSPLSRGLLLLSDLVLSFGFVTFYVR